MNKKKLPIDQPKRLAGHVKLEPRRLLNADFSLIAGSLTLDDFVDSTASADDVTISQSGMVYSFALTDGVWSGTDSAGVVGDTLSTLTVDTSLATLSSILMDSNLADAFDIDFGDFDFSGAFDITSTGGTLFDDVTQQAATSFVHTGTLDIDGATNITLGETGNNFDIVNIEGATAVTLNDTDAISLTALESTANSTVTAGGSVDLAAVVVGGNLDITAGDAVTDGGTLSVTGTTTVLATGFDITLDDAANDFIGAVSTDGASVTLVDVNAIDLGTTTATGDLDVTTGGSVTDSGTQTIIGTTTVLATGFDIALDDASNDFTGAVSTDGASVTLVDVNAIDLGTTTATGDLDVTAGGGVTDSGTQTITGATTVLATGFDITLDDAANNFTGAVSTNGANVTLVDVNAIDLGTTTATGDLDVTAGGSVTDSGTQTITGTTTVLATGFDITLDDAANNFTGAVSTDGASVTLVDVNAIDLGTTTATGDLDVTAGGSVTDSGTQTITGTTTVLATGFDITLDDAANNFTGAVSTDGANVTLVDVNAIDLGTTTATGDLDVTAGGSVTDSGTQTITGTTTVLATGFDITLDDAANNFTGAVSTNGANVTLVDVSAIILGTTAASGNLDVMTTGDITQLGDIVVAGTSGFVSGPGVVCLTDPTNDFVGEVTASGSTVELVDRNALTTGVIAAVDDVFLRSGATDSGALTLNDTVTTTAVDGQVLLQSDSGVTQAAAAIITTNDLLLGGDLADEGSGDFVLTEANVVSFLAADLENNLSFTNSISLVVADLTYSSVCPTTEAITGLNIGGNLALDVTGDLTQTAVVVVTGTSDLTASGVICLTDPTNDFMSEVTASGTTVELVDRNALTTGMITAVDDIFLRSGATDSGTLTINGSLTTTAVTGQILLQSDSGATQAGASVITTSELLVGGDLADEGTGEFDLVGINVVDTIASDIVGELHFVNTSLIVVGSLSYVSACGTSEAIAGVSATDKVRISAAGITIDEPITSTTVFLESSAGVTQGAGGSILATNLMLSGSGLFDLTNPANDTDNLAADITGTFDFVDVDAVNVAILTCDAITLTGVDVSMDLTIDTSGIGNMTQDPGASVVVGGTTLLTAGAGDICFNDPTNDFVGEVTASGSTVELVDRNALTTGVIAAVDDIFLRSGATDSGALTLNDTVTTSAVGGQVLLQSDSGVTQAVAAIITTNDLLLGGDLAVEGSGDFILTEANVVSFLAADLENNLSFTNSISLEVADLTYTSVCGTTEAIAGLNIGGDLALDVTGELTSFFSAVVVTGTSDLAATDEICLTDPTNDFVGEVTASGTTVELVDRNALTTGIIAAVDDIYLRSGATLTGALTLSGTVTTSAGDGQVLLQSDSGVTQAAAAIITTNDLLLGGDFADEGSGDFVLTEANAVSFLAADLENNLSFTNSTSLVVADLAYVSDCGTFEAITGLNIGGNLALDVTGDLTQTAVVVATGTSDLTASGVICLTDPTNDFMDEVTASGTTVELVDRNALTTGLITAVDDIFLRSGATDSGTLTINGSLTTTAVTGQVLLQSDSGATQAGASVITTSELLVGGDLADEGTGVFDLFGANVVGTLATDIIGELQFATTAAPFIFASNMLTYSSVCPTTETITGINATDKIRISADGITVTDTITSTTVFLQSTAGVTQGVGGSIVTTNLMLSGTGTFDLTNPANATDNIAADIDGTLNYVDVDDVDVSILTCDAVTLTGIDVTMILTIDTSGIGSITQDVGASVVVGTTTLLTAGTGDICLTDPTNDFVGEVTASGSTVELVDRNALTTGVIAAVDDIFLRSGATDSGALTLNGTVTTSAVDGQVLLQSDSGVTQAVGAIITTNDLLLGGDLADEGSGDFVLTEANVVSFLAADLENNLSFTNSISLVVADLTYSSVCPTTEAITGLNIGGNLALDVTGDLNQTAAVVVTGTSDLTASGVICLTDPTNDFMGEVTATGTTVELVDRNALTTGLITAVDDIFLRSGATDSGTLTINGSLTTTAVTGQVLLQSDSGATQAGASVITTSELLVGGDLADEGTGVFDLFGANVVGTIATDIIGELQFATTAAPFVFASSVLTYSSVCPTTEMITGINATDKIRISADGITVTDTITSTTVFLQSTAGVTQGAGGSIVTTNLMLSGTGTFDLTNPANATDNIAADIDGTLNYVDVDDVDVSILTCDAVTLTGIDVTMILTIDTSGIGSITQDVGASVVVGTTTLLTAGTGDICLTDPTNDFVGEVTASGSTVDLVDRNALTTGVIAAVDDIFLRSGATDSGALTLNGTVTTSAVGGQVLLQSDSGVTQAAAAIITTNDLLLGGDLADEGSGDFVLTDANVVAFLAADLENNLSFTNTTSLVVADLTYISDCGTTEAICGLDVGGDLVLDITGSLTQTASVIVGGTSNLTATVDICLTGGDCTGDGLNDNDFVGEVTAMATVVEIVDSNALIVGDIDAVDDIFLRSGDNGVGGLTINGNLTTTAVTGQVLLQSDSGATQAGASVITTSELLVGGDLADEGTGVFDLVGINVVDTIASDIVGELHFVNTPLIVVGSLSYVSACGTSEAIVGVSATDKVRIAAAGITINEPITSTTVFLESSAGVTQGASGSILTTNLMLSGTGLFDLTNPANNTDNLAALIAGTLNYIDVDDVNVAILTCDAITLTGVDVSMNLTIDTSSGNGDITQDPGASVIVGGTTLLTAGTGDICLNDPTNDFGGEVTASGSTVELVDRNALTTGVIAAVDDIFLRSGATDSGALTLNGTVTTTAVDGQVLLQSDSGVTQAAAAIITTNDLLLGGDLADEGSGDFVLTEANTVAFLAADLEDNLSFTNTTSLVVADLTYASDCLTTEAICGLNIGGDLVLDITGSLTQTASVIVQGTTSLTATLEVWLTGGDCTGDGLNDNDFVGEVTATGSSVEIVDSNALVVGVISAVDDIFLRSGDNGAGSLTLNGNLTTSAATGQVLLQSDSGVTQAVTSVITTSELLLGGDLADEGSGNFVLGQANVVDNLAADLEANLTFVNSTSLVISDLTYASACGTSEAICGLNIGGDLVLDITGNLTQTASVIVQGTTSLTATLEVWLTGGDCTGDGLNDNDFVGEVTATGSSVEIVDSNALVVGVISAVDDIFLRSGDNGAGSLTLNGNLTTSAATGQVLLQSDSGVTQAITSVITTSELLLGGDLADEGSGNFVLGQANVVDMLAADLEANLTFVNSTSLVISDLTYASACGTSEAICGLNIGGDLVLDITGSLTQTASVIVAGTSSLTATAEVWLTGGDCTGDGLNDNDFVGEVTATGTSVEIVDSNALVVGVVTAVDDIFLRSGDNGAGALTLNGNLTTSAADGQVLLQSDSGVTQAVTSVITTSELLLGGDLVDEGSGDFVLDQANVVDMLAADLEDNLTFVNSTSLVIADLTYASACGTIEAICGLDIGGDLSLDIIGNLTQTASVIVQGTTSLTATLEVWLTGGDCTGDGLNDNDFVGEVTATGTSVEIVDSNALVVGVVTAVDDIFLRSGDNGVGALTLNGSLTTSAADGQILLQSDSGVTQAVTSVITTSELLLGGDLADEGSGNFILGQANVVAMLAADLEANLTFVNSTSLVVSDLTYASACGTSEAICGLNIGGDLFLDITGSLTQTASVIVAGTSSLTATDEVWLTGGDCTGDGLNDNDFVGEVTATGTSVEIVDSNALVVGVVTAVDDIFLRSGDNGAGSLTLNGNLTTSSPTGQILLQSDSGVTQAVTSVITTSELLLGGDLADESSGNFVLGQANVVAMLAADLEANLTFVNSTSLVISDLTYASACGTSEAICGLNIGGDLSLHVTGNLTQTASVIVQGTTSLTATLEVWLTGGDCTADGLNDNDFVGEVTATGSSVEIVDSNALVVGVVSAVDDIFLRSGDNGAGALTLNGNLTTSAVDGQTLLQSDSGVTQAVTSVITTNQLLLGGDLADESSGDFVLDQANVVDMLAADLEDNLTFVNSTSLVIADLTYASACGTSEAICGLSIGGDLSLDITGDLTQTASVIVQGTSSLTATLSVWLTGGDCTADGLNDNDFVGEVTATGTSVEIVDSNALVVGVVSAVDDIFLRSGDNGAGALTLNGSLTTSAADGQILLQSDSGVTQADVITTNQLLLGGDSADEGSGNFVLTQANVVEAIVADLEDNLDFVNSTAMIVANLNYSSACGTMEAICGMDIGGNLDLDITGGLRQAGAVIVQGTTDLTATGIICWTGGDCSGDGLNDNDFVGEVTATATTVEIVDSNAMVVGVVSAVDDIFLRSGENGVGGLTLNGNLTTSSTTGQILLQSDSGVTQAAASVITTNELLLGGELVDEGSGGFNLTGVNRISNVGASLIQGTMQLNNEVDLTIAATLSYISCTPAFDQTVSGLFIGSDGASLLFADPNVALADTVQGTNGNVGQRFHPMFTQFFDIDDTGIAIQNAGGLTTEVGADVVATQADILLETTAGGVLTVNDSVMVVDPTNRILAIAGGDLIIGAGGRFERGLLGEGLVTDELNDLILENPGILSTTFAQVDAADLNQMLQFVYGTFGEQTFESTIFWGLVGTADNTFDFESLNATQLAALENLLFNGGTNFESRSFYDVNSAVDGVSTFDGFADGISDIVLSQPIGDPFDNSGTVTDAATIPTASFRVDFLRNNPDFRNVQFLFNDSNINLFENSSSELVDLNVATADFEGLARIGELPVVEVERIEFQIPQRVEITITPEVEFYQSVVVEEAPLFVQTVQEKFVVIVYFDSQFDADEFESKFDDLSRESGDKETGETDYDIVSDKLLKQLEFLTWDSTDENTALDVNQIREVLERAGLDLDDDETSAWLKAYEKWIVDREQDDTLPPPKLPRGVYKIIEVENGKAVIQGDDIDRRFVPEPDDSGDLKNYKFDEDPEPESKPDDNGTSLRTQDATTNRVARWSAMLESQTSGVVEPVIADSSSAPAESFNGAGYLGAGSTSVGLLAMLCHRNAKQNKTIEDEIQSLGELKAQSPDRNIFSRAARFKRRNEHVNRNQE